MMAAAGVVATVHGVEIVEGKKFFVISYRPRRWIRLGDRFMILRRVKETKVLPQRWVRSEEKEQAIDLVVAEYVRQSHAGHADVRLEGSGVSLLRPPSQLEDWRMFQELMMSAVTWG